MRCFMDALSMLPKVAGTACRSKIVRSVKQPDSSSHSLSTHWAEGPSQAVKAALFLYVLPPPGIENKDFHSFVLFYCPLSFAARLSLGDESADRATYRHLCFNNAYPVRPKDLIPLPSV